MEKMERILCKVTGIQPYGVFVEYNNYQGLIHISEVSDRYVADLDKLFNIGDLVYAVILEKDDNLMKLQLSYKKALKIHANVLKRVDIKIGFRTLENKLENWIKEKLEDLNHDKGSN